ncbi:MAG: hypothetical protein K2K56_05035 [Lachnospiraceae bacterium]|nr:hypothetical protein [Lachnospiraceae bacterium]
MELLKKYITMFRADMREVMSRRCGLDELNSFIMLVAFVFVLIALFTQKGIYILLGDVFGIICYIRIFSKKLDKRSRENALYMRYMGNVVAIARRVKLVVKMKIKSIQDKEYAYFVCPTCGQVVRVPKGKNKVNIRCPKCSMTFIKRT